MNLAELTPFTVASHAAAAAFGCGLVSTLWRSVQGFVSVAVAAGVARYLPGAAAPENDDDDDKTPPPPPPPPAAEAW